jgi:5-(carboxyamino)imidazole ribonucleotide synthase
MTNTIQLAAPLPPGSTLGVMGGGQLGRMFVHAAQSMGYTTCVLDPDASSPAGLVSHSHIQAAYTDEQALAQLAERCQAITTEFENVPAQSLQTLARTRPVAPAANAVAVAQNRAREKQFFEQCAALSGVTPAPYALLETEDDLKNVGSHLLPGILKTSSMGYDGKGQVRVSSPGQLAIAWRQLGRVPCVLEMRLPLLSECSLIIARNSAGQSVMLPIQKNVHHDGLLAVTEVFDGCVPYVLTKKAQTAAKAIADGLNYVGVLCVEFFVIDEGKSGTLIVNEIAPRPHNSGHYSIDACDIDQFELQVRAMANLPLVTPRLHSPAVMLNLLGDLWFTHGEQAREPNWAKVLALPGAHLHLYGKTEARKGRKMGHLTLTGGHIDDARAVARQASQILGLATGL